jgi:hypothetical protein
MDYEDEDFNTEQLLRDVDDLALHAAAARDYVGVAIIGARRGINIVTDVRLDGGALRGRVLDDLLQIQAVEANGDGDAAGRTGSDSVFAYGPAALHGVQEREWRAERIAKAIPVMGDSRARAA